VSDNNPIKEILMYRLSIAAVAVTCLALYGCGQSADAPSEVPAEAPEPVAAEEQEIEVIIEEPDAAQQQAEAQMREAAEAMLEAQAQEAADDIEPRYTEEMDQLSYGFGIQLAETLQMIDAPVNLNVLEAGLTAALSEDELAISEDQVAEIIGAFQADQMEKRQREMAGEEIDDTVDEEAQAAIDEEAGDDPAASEKNRFSYSIGVQVGMTMETPSGDPMGIRPAIFMEGVRDVMEEREMGMSERQLTDVMMAYQQKMQAEHMESMQRDAVENIAAAEAFMAENATQEGVEIIEEGFLHYEVIEAGDGPTPAETDTVRVHYEGTLIDGTEFDSSYGRGMPAEFGLNQVIQGWTRGLAHMNVGAKWKLYIHPDWAYGEMGRPGIPPNSVLIFTVELLDIVEAPQAPPVPQPAQ